MSVDPQIVQQFVAVFRTHIEDTLGKAIQTALAEQRRVEEARKQQWHGFSTLGVSWPSSSYRVSAHGVEFHFNMPSDLATRENLELVETALTAAEEATSLAFDGTRVKGGSNYVMEGRLKQKLESVSAQIV